MIIKKFLTLIITFIFTILVVNSAPEIKSYSEFDIPTGTFIPVISLQEFSTAYNDETDVLKFVATNDIFMYEHKILPKGAILTGYIEKKNEPIKGTNAMMKVFINKMYLSDGYEIPIKSYIYTSNDNKIGGEMTMPLKWNKVPHFQRWTMFRAQGVLQCVPGAERKMGEHVTISSGANLILVLVAPINMSHTVIN